MYTLITGKQATSPSAVLPVLRVVQSQVLTDPSMDWTYRFMTVL